MRLQFWAADTLRFSVTGPEPHRFLNRTAAAGVRLRHVRWQRDGYTATAGGTDRRRLERIARDGGWTLAVTARRGPGKRTERLLQSRPGLAAGAVLFLLLTALYVFTTAGLGLAAATLARNLAQVGMLSILILAPMIFLSGAWTPPEAMPAWLRALTYLSPMH